MQRRSLSDILPRADRDKLQDTWEITKAADDLGPLPAGEYRCRILSGELFTARSGTPGLKLTFDVVDGDHARRRFWLDIWLTEAAMAMAKRDLAKIGVTHLDQLDRPLPSGILATVRLALRRDDDGTERNRVVRFDPTGIEPAAPNPFAPTPPTAGPTPSSNGEPGERDGRDSGGFDWHSGQQADPPTQPGAYTHGH